MRFTLDQHELFRDAERARVARWFGDGLFEPIFHDFARGPLPVRAHLRDTWLAEAGRIIDRQVAQLRWLPFETIAIGIVLVAAAAIALPLVGDSAPLLRRIPPPAAAIPALLWPLVLELRYRLRLRALRREIGDRLCVRARVDAQFAGTGRKYNLFAGLSALLVFLAIGWGVTSAIRHDGVPDIMPLAVLFPVIWGLYFAGRRVDQVQRDRRAPGRNA